MIEAKNSESTEMNFNKKSALLDFFYYSLMWVILGASGNYF